MKSNNGFLIIVLCAILAVGTLLVTGCEETSDSASGNVIIFQNPTNVLSGFGAIAIFNVTNAPGTTNGLFLPLMWEVDNEALGRIKKSEGVTAIYESTGAIGNQTITVRDQGDAIGLTVIIQR